MKTQEDEMGKKKDESQEKTPAVEFDLTEKLVSPSGSSSLLVKLLYAVVEAGTVQKDDGMACVRLSHKLAIASGRIVLEESDLKLLKGCLANPALTVLPWASFSLNCFLWPSEVAESDMTIFNHWQEAAKGNVVNVPTEQE